MASQAVYQSTPVASLQLTLEQRERALELLALRPAVAPGSRAILNEELSKRWFALVAFAMHEMAILTPEQCRAFCDLAGVPD